VIQKTYHNDNVIDIYGRNHKKNNFVQYLLSHFTPHDVSQAIKNYFIITSNYWNGATIFWQVDEQTNVCTGKVMLYDRNIGKRIKKPYIHINWMHKVLQINGFVLQQCLFCIQNIFNYQ
jgi:hypothetical protein